MPSTQRKSKLDEATRKWRDLADRRLTYFTELYRSGRWKHYYTPESFAVRMRDVIKAAKAWGDLANRTFAPRNPGEQPVAGPNWKRGDGMRPAA
jgi:uncharacterized repeat protein (TIGR03809 family)